MKRDFNPVGVKLNIENPSIERDAFYRLCFITESNIAPRTLKVTRLQDLLDNGYSRLDLAYNFCVGVFSQQGIDTVYIRAKRSSESYVEAYNSDDNSMYYFVVLQTKDLTEIEKFNSHLVSSDEMKIQFFSQNVGSKTLQSPKLVNYYQDYTLSGGASVDDNDYYLNKAYNGVTVINKLPLPDYLLGGYGNTAVDYGVRMMVGKDYIWEIDKPNRQIRYARSVVESGWVGSREESTVNGSEVTVVATKGMSGKLLRASIIDPKVKIETISRELLKGLGKEVLDYAIPLIDPKATDWVLDPANNAVKYKVDGAGDGTATGSPIMSSAGDYSPQQFCDRYSTLVNDRYGFLTGSVKSRPSGGDLWQCHDSNGALINEIGTASNPDYNPDASGSGSEKYIPIDTVSQKVIENADAGHLESKDFLKSIPLFAYILTGSGTEAVNKAVLDIEPEATDWVLDPVNNSVKYTKKGVPPTIIIGDFVSMDYPVSGRSLDDACKKIKAYVDSSSRTYIINWDLSSASTTGFVCNMNIGDPANDWKFTGSVQNSVTETNPDSVGHIPINTVAAQVISNAEAGHAPSQEALRLSTVERVNIGEYDEALEATSIEIETSWKFLPIYDVAVQVKRNSIAGHAESIEAVNNSLPFELPDNDTPWAYVPEETSVTGSTTTIKAKRTFKNQKLKSSITVAASAPKVGKHLIKGGGSTALAFAMVELADGAVDWVLDPANNAVKVNYPASDAGNSEISGYGKYVAVDSKFYNSLDTVCALAQAKYGISTTCFIASDNYIYLQKPNAPIGHSAGAAGRYYPNRVEAPAGDNYELIPIDTVAAKVISNAEAGHAPSQEAVKATSLEGFAAGEHDAALDAAAVIDN